MAYAYMLHVDRSSLLILQTPRFDYLKSLLSDLLRKFLTFEPMLPAATATVGQGVPTDQAAGHGAGEDKGEGEREREGEGEGEGSALEARFRELNKHLESLPRNKEDLNVFVEKGYSPKLWEEVRIMYVHVCTCCVIFVESISSHQKFCKIKKKFTPGF